MPIIDGPMLDTIKVSFADSINFEQFPFCLPIIKQLRTIEFPTQVTFFIGENGTGKSTILEAIAHKAGFGAEGGSKNFTFKTSEEKHYSAAQQLADQLILSWRMKPKDGYFFRAESFYNVANYIDGIAREDARIYDFYGGKSLHHQSHGESFLAFLKIVYTKQDFLFLMNLKQRSHHNGSLHCYLLFMICVTMLTLSLLLQPIRQYCLPILTPLFIHAIQEF